MHSPLQEICKLSGFHEYLSMSDKQTSDTYLELSQTSKMDLFCESS